MSDYFGVPNMANIPNPSEWKHADTAKAWAERANNAEAHVEAMVEGLEDGLNDIDTKLRQVNTRLEEVSSEIEASATTAAQAAATASAASVQAAAAVETVTAAGTTATTKAAEATTAATNANTYKATAQNAANDAISAKNTAVSSATSAVQSATSAATSATNAGESAETAALYATNAAATAQTVNAAVEDAEEYAEAAEASAALAQARYVDADNAATAAQTSANAASATASSVTQYVQAAAASATQAETAATSANTSKTAAANSATTASTAATTATTKASEASESADDSAESASASAASATAASNSATSAATSATSASSSATNAATSATAAATSATNAANSAVEAAAAAASAHTTPVVDNFNSTSTTSALSANKGKELNDLFNGTIHHDHRVRVHINLPYKDHMDDEWNHNLVINGINQLGFSGANLCPDSDYQYASVNRYGGVTGDYYLKRGISNFVSSTHKYTEGDSSNAIINAYNATNGKTNWSTEHAQTAVGRIHTGWASFIIPGVCSSIANYGGSLMSYNCYNYGGYYHSQLLVPYTKTFVPACSDITEDATPYVGYLNDDNVSGMSYLSNSLHKYLSSCNVIPIQYKNNQTAAYGSTFTDLYSNIISYVLPASVKTYTSLSDYTTIDNPYMEMYAGLKLQSKLTYTSSVPSRAPFAINNTLSNCYFNAIHSSRVDGVLDQLSLGRRNHWHDNPILPYTPVIGNNIIPTYNNSDTSSHSTYSQFYSRFAYKNGDTVKANGFNPHMVLGIRYFDATAQEWRVFSPGDNCSYGYDGTHWNYREYLWVDLDKPVTYIVGGVRTSSTNTGGACITAGSRTTTAYDLYSYGGSSIYTRWTGNASVPQCDLIHVETPNYDNHTSYSKWRKMTLMTVDYSSSPLNYNNTVYCADSSYGAEDSGSLDMTKVSCMYSGTYNGASGFIDSDANNYSKLATSGNLIFPGTNVLTSSDALEKKYIDYCGLFIGRDTSSAATANYEGSNLEHSCYHIRIGLES